MPTPHDRDDRAGGRPARAGHHGPTDPRRSTNRGTVRPGARAVARQATGRDDGRLGHAGDDGRRRGVERRRLRIRRVRRAGAREYRSAAQGRLRRFRQSTALAVALTGLVLLISGAPDVPAQGVAVDTVVVDTLADTLGAAADSLAADSAGATEEAARSVEEAAGTIRGLVRGAYRLLPKLGIALAILAVAALLTRLARPVLRRLLASFSRAEAVSALARIGIWLVALGAALAVLAGDARALLGSVGLFGLALSWALQAPIESFSGWLLNSFRGYYRVGDRILVGDVFGDVYKIDFLTTTVWEAGGPGKPVQGAQPTGALITFPNSEVVRANITNFTREFAYVWDEIVLGIANESDLPYTLDVIRGVAERVVGGRMAEPAATYASLLSHAGLAFDVSAHPQVYIAPTDAWMDVTVRYLVGARERRHWASELQLALAVELARPEHAGRIISAYPTTRVELRQAPRSVVDAANLQDAAGGAVADAG